MKRILGLSTVCLVALAGVFMAAVRANGPEKSAAPVTYSKDVAPIMARNCVKCHRPGEVAPMSLLSYKEVRPWARSIKEKVVSRTMPPWLADPHVGEFANDSHLSQKEVETIAAWVDGGAPEGNPNDAPPNPKMVDGWNIGTPDVVITLPEPYHVPAEGVIPYKFFVVPTNFKEDRYVQFAEIRVANHSVVHHVIVDVQYPAPGQTASKAGEVNPADLEGRRGRTEESDGRLVGWAPGEAPLLLPPGEAKLVKAGSSLIFQMHYTTNGVPGDDQSSVGLIFSKVPVEKRVITSGAAAHELAIPPGASNYEAKSSFAFKEDSHIESLHPHMHYRGKDFVYTLVYPDGTSKVLLNVPRWDFNWQDTYFLKKPLAAPKGSKLECVAHYDNSTGNKYNPDPTKLVQWGPQTWEEMMIGFFDYTLDHQNLRVQSGETASK